MVIAGILWILRTATTHSQESLGIMSNLIPSLTAQLPLRTLHFHITRELGLCSQVQLPTRKSSAKLTGEVSGRAKNSEVNSRNEETSPMMYNLQLISLTGQRSESAFL